MPPALGRGPARTRDGTALSNRWLVTGATGLLGGNALTALGESGVAIGAARSVPSGSPVDFEAVDLSRPADRRGLVERTGATAVLHAAAVASIAAAAEDPGMAHEVNVVAAADLARQARGCGARFIYVSSDEVFDGTAGFYREDDPTSPQSEYARSKVSGEAAVLAANPDALVARVNFYGWSPTGHRSLSEFFLGRLRSGLETPGFADVTVSTLQVGFLVDALVSLTESGATGVLHIASSESVSKYDFGRALAVTFGLDAGLIVPAPSGQRRNRGGSNRSLDTSRAADLLGSPLPGQDAGRDRLLAEYEALLPVTLARLNTRVEAI